MEITGLHIGDIYQVADLSNARFCRHWYGSTNTLEFKTKTTKPVLYLVVPRYNTHSELELYPLNPTSQFKNADSTPNDITIYDEQDWKEIQDSLKYLGQLDETILRRIKDAGRDLYGHWGYVRSIEKDLYKEWTKKAKEQGFVEEPVTDWKPKGFHLDVAYDFLGQEVHVGDTVAYVNLGRGQELQTGSVQSITPDNFVLEALWDRDSKQARPHKYVIKIDPTKIRK